MILDWMLSSSPMFLFLVSLLLVAIYGLARLARGCLRVIGRWLGKMRSPLAHS